MQIIRYKIGKKGKIRTQRIGNCNSYKKIRTIIKSILEKKGENLNGGIKIQEVRDAC